MDVPARRHFRRYLARDKDWQAVCPSVQCWGLWYRLTRAVAKQGTNKCETLDGRSGRFYSARTIEGSFELVQVACLDTAYFVQAAGSLIHTVSVVITEMKGMIYLSCGT
jgi:hypothetical protein